MTLQEVSLRSILAISVVLALAPANVHAGVSDIVPKPVQLVAAPGAFALTEQTVLTATPGAEREAQQLASWLRASSGCELRLVTAAETNCITLELDRSLETSLGKEGYRLTVTPTRITIRSATEAGLFYGGITLQQLLPVDAFRARPADQALRLWTVPCVEIEDSPRFVWRGLLLDVARHFMPIESIKKFIDLAALHKLNMLQLHLTDDQGWRMEIQRYPLLTKIGSVRAESPRQGDRTQGDGTPYGPYFYTQPQIRELVEYAQARHVTLVPEIEMPGHFLAALAAYPQFSCTGGPFRVRTQWGIEPDVLCAGNDAAIEFALNVLAEVTDLFPSRFIHIGGDEAPRDRWKACPKCQARMRSEGFTAEAQLQTYLNHRVERFLASRGRRLIGWDEILEGGLTPDAVVMSWRGTEGGIAAATAGHDVVMSPTSHCYLDYAQGQGPNEPEAIGGFLPLETVYAFEPLPATLPETQRQHILGVQGNLWTEYIPTPRVAEYFAFPRAIALAEVAWSPAASRDLADFQQRLPAHLQRLDRLDVHYRQSDSPPEPEKTAEWSALFDGKTLQGWHEFGAKGHWKVEDGALLGNARELQQYALLVSDKEYANFTLKVKFKFREGNSGVYIRSQTRDPDEGRGPQIEIAPNGGNSTSGIYESYGRNWLAKPPEEDMVKLFKPDAWNELLISARGPHIVVQFNGVTTVDFDDPESPRTGHIILQQHSGIPNWVMFKDLELRKED